MSLQQFQNVVDGQMTDAADRAVYGVVEPATGEVYAEAPRSGAEDIDRAYVAAGRAFETWGRTTPRERSEALLRIADAIERRTEEFVAAECRNTGKPIHMTRSEEMSPTIDHFRFFAGACRLLEGRSAGEYLADHTSYVRREPIGVIGQVTPWNYPLAMMVWKIAPALAAGNTVVLKPSDTTPATSTMLAELAQEFLPPGVLNVVCGDRDTGRLLVAHPTPAMVAITGSVRAGMEVAASAATQLKRVHLELGGNAPVVVFGDAEVEEAAVSIAEAGFFNAGQDCTAATRVLVDASVHDDFVAALAEAARATNVGMPDEETAFFGALNNADQLSRVAGVVDRLPAHAEVVAGGARLERPGFFYPPTVIAGLEQHDEAVQEEIFGPVITVQSFGDEAEAIRLANDIRYGLAASVWTNDHGRAMRASRDLDFGCVWINTHIPYISEMPHGGFKHSGYGKDLSVYGLEDYTRIKHVMSRLQ
ncbi:MAG: gamma-aminobutyraldehyde dehydrogenase [Acidimicrobiales bacterium]